MPSNNLLNFLIRKYQPANQPAGGTTNFVFETQFMKFWTAIFAEFIGTMFFVLFGCGCCIANAPLMIVSLSFGLTVGTIMAAIFRISGGHINPAVTLAFLVTRKFSLVKASLYMVAQICGAIIGAMLLLNFESYFSGPNNPSSLCTPVPKNEISQFNVFFAEYLITFLIVLVMFASCDNKKIGLTNGFESVAVGLSVIVGQMFAIELTGAGGNPARVFGTALLSGTYGAHWAYWIGPLLAGATAGPLYDLILASNASLEKIKTFFTSPSYCEDDALKSAEVRTPRSGGKVKEGNF